jgi:hypothetical protein
MGFSLILSMPVAISGIILVLLLVVDTVGTVLLV